MEELKALLMEVLKDEEKVTKLLEALKDEEYVKQLLSLETAEEIQASLKEKGVEVSVEELRQIYKQLQEIEDEELSDENLDNVAGGQDCFAYDFAERLIECGK